MNIYTNFKSPFFTKSYLAASIGFILLITYYLTYSNEILKNEFLLEYGLIILIIFFICIKISNYFLEEEHTKEFAHSIEFNLDGVLLDDIQKKWSDIDQISFFIQDYQGRFDMRKWIFWDFENLQSSGCDNPILIKLNESFEVKGNVQIDSSETITKLNELLIRAVEMHSLNNEKYFFYKKNYDEHVFGIKIEK